jgi:fructose-specific phosphotransferase system IIC component
MRDQLRPFLLAFAVVFLGWYLLMVIRPDAWLEFLPVLLGFIAALVARRPIGLPGAIVGFSAWYAAAFLGGGQFEGDWQGAAVMFPLLIASGFAAGLALLWLRAVRSKASAVARP